MRLRTGLLLATLVPLLSGCSTLRATMNGWSEGPDGLARPQRELRDALAGGDFPRALTMREDDDLLRVLTVGTTAYYAGQYERSAALLDTAALLTDQRLTASVSKNGLSLVTNDLARPYQLRRTERLFVPYYGMLSWAQLGRWEDAAVEARRLAALLQQFASDRDDAERPLHAAMHYLAGTVFERAGEREAAEVAYRNAHALADVYPEHPAARGSEEGEVLVIVERGFVAHRVTETIRIGLGRDDRQELRGSDDSRHRVIERLGRTLRAAQAAPPTAAPPTVAQPSAAQPLAFRQSDVAAPPAPPTSSTSSAPSAWADSNHVGWTHDDGRRHVHEDDDDDDGARELTLVFPALRRSPRPWAAGLPRLSRDSVAEPVGVEEVRSAVSVDDASSVDERRERAGITTREIARAAARYAVTKAVRDRKGAVAGTIADIGASLFERADVRSWHLLPQELIVMRVRLPAGQHQLAVEVGDGANERRASLGPVAVKAGMVTLAPARFWREPAPRRHHHERCDSVVVSCER